MSGPSSAPRAALLLALLTASPPLVAAPTTDTLRSDLLKVDTLVRKSQRKAAPAGAKDTDALVDTFREGPDAMTTAACVKEKGGDLTCEINDYSLHALTAANVENLQLLGGESMKGVFALRKAGDATLATDFEAYCYALQSPKLFAMPASSPFANTAFEDAFKKTLGDRCRTPTVANARAFIAAALPLLEKTCQIENEGGRRQRLKFISENKWRGELGECDPARYDLHYRIAEKTGELTRTGVVPKGGDKCEDVFGDPLAALGADDGDDGDEETKAAPKKDPKPPVTMRQGLFDTAACEQVRWSETFAFMTINLDDGRKKSDAVDPRYETAMMALFEGELETARKGFLEILNRDPQNGFARLGLGVTRERLGETDEGIKEFDLALKTLKGQKIGHSLDGRAIALLHRGATRFEKGKAKEALVDFQEAAAIEPTSFDAHFWSAVALAELKRDKEAVVAFDRALSLRASFERVTDWVFGEFGDAESMLADFVTPPAEEMLNAAAWRLAVSKDSAARNGARALKYVKEALELVEGNNGRYLDTLAVAYAASGKFKEAVEAEQQAIEVIAAEGAEADERAAMEKRLALYKDGKTYME